MARARQQGDHKRGSTLERFGQGVKSSFSKMANAFKFGRKSKATGAKAPKVWKPKFSFFELREIASEWLTRGDKSRLVRKIRREHYEKTAEFNRLIPDRFATKNYLFF